MTALMTLQSRGLLAQWQDSDILSKQVYAGLLLQCTWMQLGDACTYCMHSSYACGTPSLAVTQGFKASQTSATQAIGITWMR